MPAMNETTDVVIVGAGIVGLATAHALLAEHPGLDVIVVEKEARHASHQTGHNSGVIHSGLYYAPGSNKAAMVAAGRVALERFCDEHGIAHETCGKVVVATEIDELARLDALEQRAAANGIAVRRLDRHGLRELEPHIEGMAALHVPSAGIVSFPAVCDALVGAITSRGGQVRTGAPVVEIRDNGAGVVATTPIGEIRAAVLVNCAGLQSDRIATLAGAPTNGVRIMPFRGEYYELADDRRSLCRNLVYPVPDPAFPFLGVHLTRMIDGSIHAGPNAVPAAAREGYRWRDVNGRDLREVLLSRRTWKLARRYWRTGAAEVHRSLRRAAFVRALQRLCPEIRDRDLVASAAGVRAQAIDAQGRLLDDFAFAETARAVHVLNAPSPAATASLEIGRTIAAKAADRLPRHAA
jgi:L-2-hydroxyglutarate oxidase